MPCDCSDTNPRVTGYWRVEWENGTTDVQVRKLSRGYRVIEHCCEHRSPDGTLVSEVHRCLEDALDVAVVYAKYGLYARKGKSMKWVRTDW